jgi:hypothetical protein
VAALACPPEDREQGRVCVERALAIERKLMSGGRYRPVAGSSPLDVIAELEELLRRLLKGLAVAELAGDLRAAADEALLSEGLSATYVDAPSVGETAEWRLPEPSADDDQGLDLSEIADGHLGNAEIEVKRIAQDAESDTETNEKPLPSVRQDGDYRSPVEEDTGRTTRIMVDDVELPEIVPENGHQPAEPDRADWFSAADGELEWPAFARPRRGRPRDREPSKDRVRYLFPVPDATDWSVGELHYERKKSK